MGLSGLDSDATLRCPLPEQSTAARSPKGSSNAIVTNAPGASDADEGAIDVDGTHAAKMEKALTIQTLLRVRPYRAKSDVSHVVNIFRSNGSHNMSLKG